VLEVGKVFLWEASLCWPDIAEEALLKYKRTGKCCLCCLQSAELSAMKSSKQLLLTITLDNTSEV